jgi:hypothetical protein
LRQHGGEILLGDFRLSAGILDKKTGILQPDRERVELGLPRGSAGGFLHFWIPAFSGMTGA